MSVIVTAGCRMQHIWCLQKAQKSPTAQINNQYSHSWLFWDSFYAATLALARVTMQPSQHKILCNSLCTSGQNIKTQLYILLSFYYNCALALLCSWVGACSSSSSPRTSPLIVTYLQFNLTHNWSMLYRVAIVILSQLSLRSILWQKRRKTLEDLHRHGFRLC